MQQVTLTQLKIATREARRALRQSGADPSKLHHLHAVAAPDGALRFMVRQNAPGRILAEIAEQCEALPIRQTREELDCEDSDVRMAHLGDVDLPGSTLAFQFPAKCPKCGASSLLCHGAVGIDLGQVVALEIDTSCRCYLDIDSRKLVVLEQLHPAVKGQMKALGIFDASPFGEYERMRQKQATRKALPRSQNRRRSRDRVQGNPDIRRSGDRSEGAQE